MILGGAEQGNDVVQLKEARLYQEMMEITFIRNQLLNDLHTEKLR